MKADVMTALEAYDDDFGRIDDYHVVPNGTYWTVVEDVTVDVAKPSENARIVWTLRILGPDQFGSKLRRVFVITRDSLKWLKRDLYVCRFRLDSLSELPAKVDNLSNLKLKVRKSDRSVHILGAAAGTGATGKRFLHLFLNDETEYLDQQIPDNWQIGTQKEFEDMINVFVGRYGCPFPEYAFLEDSSTGEILFSFGDV